jgi:hypothetical protein
MQVEIIKKIAADAGDIDCHEVVDRADLDAAIAETDACVVVTGGPGLTSRAEYGELLYRHPRLRVLAIKRDGSSVVHELRPYRSLIGDISPTELVNTIRRAADAEAKSE